MHSNRAIAHTGCITTQLHINSQSQTSVDISCALPGEMCSLSPGVGFNEVREGFGALAKSSPGITDYSVSVFVCKFAYYSSFPSLQTTRLQNRKGFKMKKAASTKCIHATIRSSAAARQSV